jgi:hypothetical protein
LPDHLDKRHPAGVTAFYFNAKRHSPAVNPVAGLEGEMEAQVIDGRHRGFVVGFASKPVGDQREWIGVIRIHTLDNSWPLLRHI